MLQVAEGQLPSPNNLPKTFSSLMSTLKEELIQVRKVQVCINIVIFMLMTHQSVPYALKTGIPLITWEGKDQGSILATV